MHLDVVGYVKRESCQVMLRRMPLAEANKATV